jgi:hypothetical protein
MNSADSFRRFWRTLFDADDCVCVAKYVEGTSLRLASTLEAAPLPWAQFVAVNAFRAGTSRANRHVARHRSFLVEFDRGTPGEQTTWADAARLPWSTRVFSGRRSLHFVVTLDEPVAPEDYRQLAARLLAAMPEADQACRDPSRLTRYPDVVRVDTGKQQSILGVRERVSRAAFETWLASRVAAAKPLPVPARARPPLASRGRLRNRTLGFLAHGAERDRNVETFAAACDFAECGYSVSEALAHLLPLQAMLSAQKDHAFPAAELRAAVANAFRTVLRRMQDESLLRSA